MILTTGIKLGDRIKTIAATGACISEWNGVTGTIIGLTSHNVAIELDKQHLGSFTQSFMRHYWQFELLEWDD